MTSETVTRAFHESMLWFALFSTTAAMILFAPIVTLLCSKKQPKTDPNLPKGVNLPSKPGETATIEKKSEATPPNKDSKTSEEKKEEPPEPNSDGSNLRPRNLLPTNPDEMSAYKKIVQGKTRPPKDNETMEDCDSDWGSVQVIEKLPDSQKKGSKSAKKGKKETSGRKKVDKSSKKEKSEGSLDKTDSGEC